MSFGMLHTLYYYDKEIVKLLVDKYDFDMQEAFRKYINSETYDMMRDEKLQMWDFAPYAIFDMWEVEQITGDPRNSKYISR